MSALAIWCFWCEPRKEERIGVNALEVPQALSATLVHLCAPNRYSWREEWPYKAGTRRPSSAGSSTFTPKGVRLSLSPVLDIYGEMGRSVSASHASRELCHVSPSDGQSATRVLQIA